MLDLNNTSNPVQEIDFPGGHRFGTSYNYTGQTPQNAFTNHVDDNGDLDFFIVDNQIYDRLGRLIGVLNHAISPGLGMGPANVDSEIEIISVPGKCKQYYIVYYHYEPATQREGFYYTTLNMGKQNVEDQSVTGDITIPDGNSYKVNVRQLFVENNTGSSTRRENWKGYSIMTTQVKNNQRFLFIAGSSNLRRFVVDQSGIHDNNNIWDLNTYFSWRPTAEPYKMFDAGSAIGVEDNNSSLSDSDVQRLPNGNYRMSFLIRSKRWLTASTPLNGIVGTDFPVQWNDFSSILPIGKKMIFVLDIDQNSGGIVANSIKGIHIPETSRGSNLVRGLEFSASGRYLYFSMEESPYLGYVDLNAAYTDFYTLNTLSVAGADAANFKRGNIEKDVNNQLYFAGATHIATLSDAEAPTTATWDGTAITVGIPNRTNGLGLLSEQGYNLPDQIDDEPYDKTANLLGSIVADPGQNLCDGNTVTFSFTSSFPNDVTVEWGDGTIGFSKDYTLATGNNTITCTVTNQFGCDQAYTLNVNVVPKLDFDITAPYTQICNPQYQIALGYVVHTRGAEVGEVEWYKDGVLLTGNWTVANQGPGNYCVRLQNGANGCFSDLKCVDITEAPCANLTSDFSGIPIRVGNNFEIHVTPVEQQTCYSNWYKVYDVTNGTPVWLGTAWHKSGKISYWPASGGGGPFSLFPGTSIIRLEHCVWSPCSWGNNCTSYSFNNGSLRKATADGNTELLESSIFPNPVTDQLNIELGSGISAYSIKNTLGQELVRGTPTTADLSQFENGVYFIFFLNAKGEVQTTQKFVKH